jgi:hypothetical protein
VIAAETIFSATGRPSRPAAATAASAEATSSPGTTGTPARASSDRPADSGHGRAAPAGGGSGSGSSARTWPRPSSQRSALPSARSPWSMPPSTWMWYLASISRAYGLTSMLVAPIGMTGIGDDAIRWLSQASRSSMTVASRSSAGRASGTLTPENVTKSRPGSCTAASSARSIVVSVPVRWLARPYPVTSSGLRAVANGGISSLMAAAVPAANGGITSPWSVARSAMMSQAPPEAVSTPIRRPRGHRS